ncbi:MAG: pyridoxine 5'-phosphate synthase [Verrucomicrobiota bacterium]|nr:pyridoxine 5'-phosphate synthase [Verrucomicrobiota bacterium]
MVLLGVNIDHIATLRQARYPMGISVAPPAEPDVVEAARVAEQAGAHSITVHLREDRRHIQDADVTRLRKSITTRLNLEMAVVPTIIDFALLTQPDEVCLVPEKRQEVTTEGGLDILGNAEAIGKAVDRLKKAGIKVSLFIDPTIDQVVMASKVGADIIELHTGCYAGKENPADTQRELTRLIEAAIKADECGLVVNAGHGLNYSNVKPILSIPKLNTLNIGHSIVSRSVFTGLDKAIRDMLTAIN